MSEARNPDAVDRYLDRLRRAPMPPLDAPTLDAARRAFVEGAQKLYPSTPAMVAIAATALRPSGCPALRVYRGTSIPDVALLFLHGGGFVMGSLDSHDALCRDLAARTGAVVVAVDYRLAPQHPYPAAHADARAAMHWLAANLQSLGVPAGRIAVMGDSAGGNLAATLALEEPRPLLQVLLYPALDLDASSPSHVVYGTGYGLDSATITFCYDAYTPDSVSRRAASLASRNDLSRAVPAIIAIGELDPLRDEALTYAERLGTAGVSITLLPYPRMVHGFMSMPRLFTEAGQALDEIVKAIGHSLRDVMTPTRSPAESQS